jgi:DNA-binding CsgD family transcriptional regulator
MASATREIAATVGERRLSSTAESKQERETHPGLVAILALLQGSSPTAGCIDVVALWRLLINGQLRVRDVSYVGGRCFGVLASHLGTRLSAGEVSVLERALRGESLKAVAIDLGVAPSTLSTRCKDLMKTIGTGTSIHHAPIFLVMACQATAGVAIPYGRFEGCNEAGHLVISTDAVAAELRTSLSEAEWEVTVLSVEGRSTDDLSHQRGTSRRTTANQLAAIFRKLGVGNRRALRAKAAVFHPVA